MKIVSITEGEPQASWVYRVGKENEKAKGEVIEIAWLEKIDAEGYSEWLIVKYFTGKEDYINSCYVSKIECEEE